MSDYFDTRLLAGDCIERLRSLEPCSIDAIVTDPPYELSFMGKQWDATGIAYRLELWAECLRVLKPGGHLLAFGGTRTYHRMTCAIEDAGFEIRDSIHWTYGSGFPKSLDVSKAIDKGEGHWRGKAGDVTTGNASMDRPNYERTPKGDPITAAAAAWQGYGTALKPSHEPVVVARKPLAGTVAGNVLAHGTGGLNIDGCRVGSEGATKRASQETTKTSTGWTTGHDVLQLNAGRWPANTVLTHAAGCQQTGTRTDTMTGGFGNGGIGMGGVGLDQGEGKGAEWQSKSLEVAVWACAPGCPVAELDRQSGVSKDGTAVKRRSAGKNFGSDTKKPTTADQTYGGMGGASRFFTQANWDEEWDGPQVYQEQQATTVPVWECVAGCPVAELDQQSGVTRSGLMKAGTRTQGYTGPSMGKWQPGEVQQDTYADSGGASRFFTQANWDEEWDGPQVLYVPKPSKREKNAGLDDLEDQVQDPSDYERAGTTNPRNRSQLQRKNFHPTTKPVALMRHLVRLVTPPGGVVLDPFLGSGTTAVAAILEGFEWKGCELTEEYLPIIKGRVEHARATVRKTQQQAAEAAASEQASGGAAECASAA